MRSAVAALLFWAALFGQAASAAECRDDRVDLRGDWGKAQFSVEVAQSMKEISVGLMNRPSMPKNAGMLFVYEAPRQVHFWMKNTLIPLDMVFMSAEGVVRRVHANAVPLDETPIYGGDDIQFVLEINGGMAALLGIGPGTELRHPAINQSSANWACTDE